MKRFISILLAAILTLALLPTAFAEEEAPLFATMAETLAEDVTTGVYGWNGSTFIAVARVDNKYIRAVALTDEETAAQVKALYEADDFEAAAKQLEELAAALPVTYTEDITASLKDQAELDTLIGKTVGELTDEGWSLGSYGWGDVVEFTFRSGLFDYTFVANEPSELFEERYNSTEDYSDFTVKSVRFEGVSGAALDLQYQADGTYVPEETEYDESGMAVMELLGQILTAAENGEEIDVEALMQSLTELDPEQADSIQSILPLIQDMLAEKTAEETSN